ENDAIAGGPTNGPNRAEVADRLAAAAKLLKDTINFEIGGTTQGRQATLKAQALVDAAEQFQSYAGTAGLRPANDSQALQAVTSARRSPSSLQATLHKPA